MENNIRLLPIGSIVLLKGTLNKIMIVSRCIGVSRGEGAGEYEYAGCEYPQGITDDKLIFFDSKGIAKLVFEGYNSDENDVLTETMQNWREARKKI